MGPPVSRRSPTRSSVSVDCTSGSPAGRAGWFAASAPGRRRSNVRGCPESAQGHPQLEWLCANVRADIEGGVGAAAVGGLGLELVGAGSELQRVRVAGLEGRGGEPLLEELAGRVEDEQADPL